MTEYRLYFLDDKQHIRAAKDFVAPDDQEARRLALEHDDGRPKEVWQRARQVWVLQPER